MNIKLKISDIMQTSEVTFGTSGARGKVDNMSDHVCFLYTSAFIQHCLNHQFSFQQVAIGGDLRASSPSIIQACMAAIKAVNKRPLFCGYLATPALAYYAMHEKIPCIMVTGSHIPEDRNGIKFYRPDGEILKPDELAIKAMTVELPRSLFKGKTLRHRPKLDIDLCAQKRYITRYTDFFNAQSLSGLSIGVYQHSGVARDVFVEVLTLLGAKVTAFSRSAQFVPVDTEAIRTADIHLAKQQCADNNFDAIISSDGDADRPLVSDHKGHWIHGDILGILCAQYLNIKAIVTPISSNTCVEKSNLFQLVKRCKIGSPFVIQKMQTLAQCSESIAGYEANGGFLLQTDVTIKDRKLLALPTRDAMIVILSCLRLIKEKNRPLSEIISQLPQRFTYSNRLKDIPTATSQALLEKWIGAPSPALNHIEKILPRSFPRCTAFDLTDGLRLIFENEEIIHFRPSGNAPEFRCYCEATTLVRAQQLNEQSLAFILKATTSHDTL